ncbi:MAG TPA: hypothetical protein ENN57_03530 [Chloroflexi bacterium]|nr:hypothetical protein [Chloroflexota bacterium]
MPFPVKAIQVDGGSEFEAIFEEECQKRNIRLFVLPPNSPKLNGCVERAHLTHTEEFCEVTDSSFNIVELKDKLLDREKVSNTTIRPHQFLGYLTSQEYLECYLQNKKEVMCHQGIERGQNVAFLLYLVVKYPPTTIFRRNL